MAANIGARRAGAGVALPPPVQRPDAAAEPLRLGVPEGFLFLFVFDYLSTIQRKNPVGLIEAFKRAFAPGEGARLLIKTINGPLRPLAEEEVLWAADGREDIHVVDRSLSGAELAGLMAACDCYASLHRAEGFGLTLAEAMAIGKPTIATGYSGNVDFMDAENSYLVDYTIGRVGPECEIYPPEGEWADPSVEHAAELMRRVYEQPREAERRGARAAQDIARELSPRGDRRGDARASARSSRRAPSTGGGGALRGRQRVGRRRRPASAPRATRSRPARRRSAPSCSPARRRRCWPSRARARRRSHPSSPASFRRSGCRRRGAGCRRRARRAACARRPRAESCATSRYWLG